MGRRATLAASTFLAGAMLAGCGQREPDSQAQTGSDAPTKEPEVTKVVGKMPYRRFGKTGLEVSEVGFGAWPIGGQAYGAVDRAESLRALARAEELGCNFVDTALVYGESELVIGEFLHSRRDKWIVATKYSGQEGGMTSTLEQQLRRLNTDVIDYYQIHWAPHDAEKSLYEELYRLKKTGKVRFVGVSLRSPADIDYVIDNAQLDGVMLPLSLLDPLPFLARVTRLRESGLAVIARSSLKEGFLTGRYKRDATFTDPNDQRSQWSREQIAQTVDRVEQLRFLEPEAGSLLLAAARYPLSFPDVSTALLGTKSVAYADSNFGVVPGGRLSGQSLERVATLQDEMGLWTFKERMLRQLRQLLGQ